MDVYYNRGVKSRDKLTGYKTLVLINLSMAIALLCLRLVIKATVQTVATGDTTGVDGPTVFAATMLGTFFMMPVTLILLIVPAIITVYQSAKLLDRKTLSTKSVWFVLAVIGVTIEVIAVFV